MSKNGNYIVGATKDGAVQQRSEGLGGDGLCQIAGFESGRHQAARILENMWSTFAVLNHAVLSRKRPGIADFTNSAEKTTQTPYDLGNRLTLWLSCLWMLLLKQPGAGILRCFFFLNLFFLGFLYFRLQVISFERFWDVATQWYLSGGGPWRHENLRRCWCWT